MRHIAAMLVGLCVLLPLSVEATSRNYVYIGGENGNLWGVDVDSGETRLLTSSTVNTTTYTNALAANDNACIAYYGVGTSMYWWDETTDSHTLLSDLATDYPGVFTGGTLQSGGGTYWNENDSLFIGAEPVAAAGDVEALYVASLDSAGTTITGLTRIDINSIAAADPETPVANLGGFGDLIVVDNGSGGPLVVSATRVGTTTQNFWTFNVATSSFTLIRTGTENWQLAKTPDGRVWRGQTVSGVNTLQEVDISTGLTVGDPITVTGPSSIADLTAPACRPQIGIAKRASTPTSNGDGTFTVTYTLEVEAFEDFDLYDVQVTDDLATEFGSLVAGTPDDPGEYTVSSGPTVRNATGGADLSANPSFDGDSDQDLLTLTSGDVLPIDSTLEIVFDVTFMPALGTTSWDNQAEATGDTREDGTDDGDTDDLSDDGTDADPGDGDGGQPNDDPEDDDESDPTTVSLDSQIGIAKRAVSLSDNSDGTWTVTYSMLVENLGDLTLFDIRVTDDLATEFGTAVADPDSESEYAVVSGPTVGGQLGGATISQSSSNGGYNGSGDTVMITPTAGEYLPPGSSFVISLVVRFFPDPAVAVYYNQARATGDEGEDGDADEDTADLSDDGSDPDPGDGDSGPPNGDPGDSDEDDPTPIELDPQIGIAKRAVSVTNNGDGTWTVDYAMLVGNIGDLPLYDLRVTDDLTTEFGTSVADPDAPGEYVVVSGPTVGGQLGGTTVSQASANAGYNGGGDQVLVAPTSGEYLPVGSVFAISVSVRFFPNPAVTEYLNQARATGDVGGEDGVADEDTVDLSDDGTEPDSGDGSGGPPNGDPRDADEDDPTEVEVQFSPESIPTLDHWGIVAMILLLAGTAIRRLTV